MEAVMSGNWHGKDCPFPDFPMCPCCSGKGYITEALCGRCHGTGHVFPQARQRVNDEAADWDAIEARDRFSREGDVETPLGQQIEGE